MLLRRSLALTLNALFLPAFVTTPARAQGPTTATTPTPPTTTADAGKGYMVLTKDGKVVTGTLVERDDLHVSLRLPNGDTQRIEALEIDKAGPLESGTSSDMPQGLAPMPPSPGKPSMPAIDAMRPPRAEDHSYKGADAVSLHLALPESTTAVTLYQRDAGNAWRAVCSADCTPKVDPRGTYMVGGFMVRDSASFELPQGARGVTVHSSPTFTTNTTLGWIFLGIGAGLAGANTTLYEVLPEKNAAYLIPVGVGAVLAVVGLYELLKTTSVDVSSP